MSASNVDSNVSAPGAHETANYEHYQAGKSKLLSSKDKYELDAMCASFFFGNLSYGMD